LQLHQLISNHRPVLRHQHYIYHRDKQLHHVMLVQLLRYHHH
jgi:hypothetical protein